MQGDMNIAEMLLSKSLHLYIEYYGNENNIDIADGYNVLGVLYFNINQLDKAQNYYEVSH